MDSLVGDILNQKGWFLYTVEPGATVFSAIQTMAELDIGALVVVDSSAQVSGILTERDYVTKIGLQGRSSRRTFVDEVMTDTVEVIDPDLSIRQCLYLMTQRRCRHLPVIRNGAAEGLISIGDCAREISRDRDMTVQYFVDFIQRRYPV